MPHKKVIDKIRAIAKKHGWAVGVHGTLKRDIDLIAVPWVWEAKSWYKVFIEIERAVGYELNITSPKEEKPIARFGRIIVQKNSKPYVTKKYQRNWRPPAIDISFVDPRMFK